MHFFSNDICGKEWMEFIEFHQVIEKYPAKAVVISAGEPVDGLFFVKKGKVKVLRAAGKEELRVCRLAGDGDILGHRGFGGSHTYPITAVTLAPTTLIRIPQKPFEVIAKSNARFSYALMLFFAEELRKTELIHPQVPVRNRIAIALMQNYEAFGFEENEPGLLSYTLSRKEMASLGGTTYESTVRVLSDLNKHKMIGIEGKRVRLLDVAGLKALATPPFS